MYLLLLVYQCVKSARGKGHTNAIVVSLALCQLLVCRLVLRSRSRALSPFSVFSPSINPDCDFMVLLGTANLTKASGVCKGPFYKDSKIANRNNVTLRKIFFNLCKGIV